jgi:hypothetical protein
MLRLDYISPAHLMLLMPGGFDAKQFTTDHASGFPYICEMAHPTST